MADDIITDEHVVAFIQRVRKEITELQPLDTHLDARLTIALGWLRRACQEALDAVREDRNLRITHMIREND